MYMPSRAVMLEWQRSNTRQVTYGAINEDPVAARRRQQALNQEYLDYLSELESRTNRVFLMDNDGNDMSIFSALGRAYNNLSLRAILETDDEDDEIVPLPDEIIEVWNIIIVFLLILLGFMLFILILVFVTVESQS